MNRTPKLLLYNTLKGKKEVLKTIIPNKATLYVCGPTLYDEIHVGNTRPLIVFDVLYRILTEMYSEVVYVRNVTDIDDKIIHKAQILGISTNEVVKQQSKIYNQVLTDLNILPPTYEPYATNHITDMIQIINLLLNKGYAYIKENHVFFNIKKFKEYGSLSNRTEDNTVLGLGNNSIVKNIKENWEDFVLWKPSKLDEPVWEAPFGNGRPGWHIECSAMSYKYLGKHFDIHGGGIDLLFPHHENERAQTMAAFNCSNTANIWMHNNFMHVNNDKMSKSLGNVVKVTDVLQEFHGEVLRLSILLTHYRHPITFSRANLIAAKNILDKIYNALRLAENTTTYDTFNNNNLVSQDVINLKQTFLDVLLDDLNTHLAIQEVQKIVTQINKTNNKKLKHELINVLNYCVGLLGIVQENPQQWFSEKLSISEEDIQNMVQKRSEAKLQKDYALADSIRENLLKQGILLEDNKNTTTWRKL